MSDDEFFEPLQHTIIEQCTSNISLIKLSFIDVVRYTSHWTYNRTIDVNRVDELFTSLSNKAFINPPWLFHSVFDSNEDSFMYKIIDGSHRLEAIRRFVDNEDNYVESNNRFVYTWLYDIPNAENSLKTVELFKKINNNFIISNEQLPDLFIMNLVEEVCKHNDFKDGIIVKDTTTYAHKPKIHKKELRDLFVSKRDILENMTISEIISKMDYINKLLLKKQPRELASKSKDYDKVTKAYKLNFCLNLYRFTPDKWIEFINHDKDYIKSKLS